jgi:hypothetical protein
MKEFDLTQVKVGDLDESDTILLKDYLKTLPKKKVKNFILHVLDTEYSLDVTTPENDKVLKFLADKLFIQHHHNIINNVDEDENISIEPIQSTTLPF